MCSHSAEEMRGVSGKESRLGTLVCLGEKDFGLVGCCFFGGFWGRHLGFCLDFVGSFSFLLVLLACLVLFRGGCFGSSYQQTDWLPLDAYSAIV